MKMFLKRVFVICMTADLALKGGVDHSKV